MMIISLLLFTIIGGIFSNTFMQAVGLGVVMTMILYFGINFHEDYIEYKKRHEVEA